MSTQATDGPTVAQLQERLQQRLTPSRLEVLDESFQHAGHAGANGTGFGTHFRVRLASPLFAGKSRVAQHRLVYDALQDFIDQGLHALAIESEASPAGTPLI
jgi:BolA protein